MIMICTNRCRHLKLLLVQVVLDTHPTTFASFSSSLSFRIISGPDDCCRVADAVPHSLLEFDDEPLPLLDALIFASFIVLISPSFRIHPLRTLNLEPS